MKQSKIVIISKCCLIHLIISLPNLTNQVLNVEKNKLLLNKLVCCWRHNDFLEMQSSPVKAIIQVSQKTEIRWIRRRGIQKPVFFFMSNGPTRWFRRRANHWSKIGIWETFRTTSDWNSSCYFYFLVSSILAKRKVEKWHFPISIKVVYK